MAIAPTNLPDFIIENQGHNTLNYTEQGGCATHVGGALIIDGALIVSNGAYVYGLTPGFHQLENQAYSEATTIAQLKEDFNLLLENLKDAGLMDEGEVSAK